MKDFSDQLIPWLGRTAKMLDNFHTKKMADNGFDLTKDQWVLLRVLSHNNGVSQNELACLTNRDKTAMTRLVNTVEKKNFIARIPSKEDKRINLLFLTKEGEKVLHATLPFVEQIFSTLQEEIQPEEIAQVIDVMKRIQKNITNIEGC